MLYLSTLAALVMTGSAALLPSPSPAETYLPPGPGTRSQQAIERNAAVLKLDQEVGDNGFRYSYETSNNIQAEESGDVFQTRGAFSYKGDDGTTYTVTFTAGEGGYQPQGDHLPVPPPTPVEILLALEQNARDEAAGIFDDGQYHLENSGAAATGQKSPKKQGFNTNSGYTY